VVRRYDNVLAKGNLTLEARIAFMSVIDSNCSPKDRDAFEAWRVTKLEDVVKSLDKPTIADIPGVMSLLQCFGYSEFTEK